MRRSRTLLGLGVVSLIAWTGNGLANPGRAADPWAPTLIAQASAIDPGAVGSWELLVPGAAGTLIRWRWEIRADGTYRFSAEGAGAPPAHSGTVTFANGQWILQAKEGQPGYGDAGTYRLDVPGSMMASGKNGIGVWRKLGPAEAAAQTTPWPKTVPEISRKAMGMARAWRPDAILIEVNAQLRPPAMTASADPNPYEFALVFYSPAEQATLSVHPGSPAGEVFPGGRHDLSDRLAIPEAFLDLDAAIAEAQAQGMRGRPERASLALSRRGTSTLGDLDFEGDALLAWTLWPLNANRIYPIRADLAPPSPPAPPPAEAAKTAPPASSGCCAARDPMRAADLFAQGRERYLAKDFETAARLFRAAAELGHARAQLQIGYQHEYGEGVPANAREAARWYRLAAEQGDATAESNLGLLYEEGRGVPEDWMAAAYWYKQSAEQSNPSGMFRLARAWEYGIGLPQNRQAAIAWYDRAAATGDSQAAYFARHLRGLMSISFRTEEERNLIGYRTYRDPRGRVFRNANERTGYLLGERQANDAADAWLAFESRAREYDSCRAQGRDGCGLAPTQPVFPRN